MAVTEANAAIVGGDFADIVDGPALVSGEGDEAVDEVIATDDGSSTKDAFSLILQELEVMLMDEAFNERVDAFAEEHCHEFEDSDENKLIYTALFNDYSAMVETFIEERLGASVQSFDMAGFCATLAERAKANDGDLPPPLEMLHSMTDFDAFKELFRKSE
jgi:ADP-ribosylation factor 2-binding protein